MHRRYQGLLLWQVWAPGQGRCAGWSLSGLGPSDESLLLCRRQGLWYFTQIGVGFQPNEEGDGFLPVVPDHVEFPVAYALTRRSFSSRYSALWAASWYLPAQPSRG